MPFRVSAPFQPMGDQPQAIAKLAQGVREGVKHQTLLGATATGKSLGWNEQVFVVERRAGKDIPHVMPIGQLIDDLMKRQPDRVDSIGDTQILDQADVLGEYLVQSFSPETGAVDLYPVKSFTRHESPAAMYRVTTACGRSAVLTGDHNLWVLRDGRLQLIETASARPTDYIPLPEALLGDGNLKQLDLLASASSYRVYVHARETTLSYVGQHGNHDLISALSAGGISDYNKLYTIQHQVRGDGIEPGLFHSDARSKRLPIFWPQLASADLGLLLQAYFDGDGTVEQASTITATTASAELASDLAYALLRFGIWARISRRWKRATNTNPKGDWYYQVSISGQADLRRFQEGIGFSIDYKRDALAMQLGREEHSSVDLVPINGVELGLLRRQLGLFAHDLAGVAGVSRTCVQAIETGKRKPQRATLKAILEALHQLAQGKELSATWHEIWLRLRGLCNLRWTPVAEVEAVPYDAPYVYDFTVPGAETFLAGSGGFFVHNTYVVAKIFEELKRPMLVLAHNKTLVSQLYQEFKEFLPESAVEMFISYYDTYTPEAYVPSKDLYIEKEASINEEIDRLRHSATQALLTRPDVLIVASVSAIYGLGSPHDYGMVAIPIRVGEVRNRDKLLRQLIDLQFERNDIDFHRGTFRVRGDTIDVMPANSDIALRIEFWGDEIERLTEFDPLTGEVLVQKTSTDIYPAKHFITTNEKLALAVSDIQNELIERVTQLEAEGKQLEAQRLKQRTSYDIEMLGEVGYCSGIENYSRHMDRRLPGQTPWTLIDYFPDDFVLVVDESHITLPQVRGMYKGDRSRKETLVEYGFRLPSAMDNRPLQFDEFEQHIHQAIYVSATPGPYEYEHTAPEDVVEQIIRPTGLVDPVIQLRPTKGQIDDLLGEVRSRVDKGQRVLVTTLTKRMAEDLADYLKEMGVRTHYLHSDIDALERVDILRDLRLGVYDVVVGINLLREGLDLPEVSLVAILDADKEGFLRSASSLIQIIGRAARHLEGTVIMYGDNMTGSMRQAIDETNRRRDIQIAYNRRNNITPVGITKEIRDLGDRARKVAEPQAEYSVTRSAISRDELARLIKDLEKQMKQAAKDLAFEKAAALRDEIVDLRKTLALEEA